jgi:hypothetical protein
MPPCDRNKQKITRIDHGLAEYNVAHFRISLQIDSVQKDFAIARIRIVVQRWLMKWGYEFDMLAAAYLTKEYTA